MNVILNSLQTGFLATTSCRNPILEGLVTGRTNMVAKRVEWFTTFSDDVDDSVAAAESVKGYPHLTLSEGRERNGFRHLVLVVSSYTVSVVRHSVSSVSTAL